MSEWEDFGKRQGDYVNSATAPPELPKALKAIFVASALKQLDQLATIPEGVVPPFEQVDPEYAFEEFAPSDKYFTMLRVDMSVLLSAVTALDKQTVIDYIHSGETFPWPVGQLLETGQVLLYRGVELATARSLLGDSDLKVELVEPA